MSAIIKRLDLLHTQINDAHNNVMELVREFDNDEDSQVFGRLKEIEINLSRGLTGTWKLLKTSEELSGTPGPGPNADHWKF